MELDMENESKKYRLSAVDVVHKHFKKTFRGFDPQEVENFLYMVSRTFEEMNKDISSSRQKTKQLEIKISEYQEKEQMLKETMVTAQRMTEDIKKNAQKEYDLIVAEAEIKADKIINSAQTRLNALLEDIKDLRQQKSRFMNDLKHITKSYLSLIELEEQDEKEQSSQEDKLVVMKTGSDSK